VDFKEIVSKKKDRCENQPKVEDFEKVCQIGVTLEDYHLSKIYKKEHVVQRFIFLLQKK
jgi:hypothetical protein